MMIGELIVGWLTGSLALTADGWHMGTHVGALGLALVAYWYARTRAGKDTFSFGTGKVYALAGFTSGVLLAIVALWMANEGIERLITHPTVDYGEALPIAALGLVVNIVSAMLLGQRPHYGHGHAATTTLATTTRPRSRPRPRRPKTANPDQPPKPRHARLQPARRLHPHHRRRDDVAARDRRAVARASTPACGSSIRRWAWSAAR